MYVHDLIYALRPLSYEYQDPELITCTNTAAMRIYCYYCRFNGHDNHV
jgi:hypothetical protein